MDQIPQRTCNDFSLHFYNNYLLNNRQIDKNIEDLEIIDNNNIIINKNHFNNINNTEYTSDSEENIFSTDNQNTPDYDILKYNINKEKNLKEILNKNKKNTNEGLKEINSKYLSNYYGNDNENNLGYSNISLNNNNNNQMDKSEKQKEINNVPDNYSEIINNKNSLLNFIYYQNANQNLFDNINPNPNIDNLKMFISQDKMFSSNNINYNTFNNINNFDLNNHNEFIKKNNFNYSINENLLFTKSFDNYNQFLNSNIITEISTETNEINDPNSKENLKKIEQQITSLLFSSQKNNSIENSKNNNGNNKIKKKISNLHLEKKRSLSRLVSQLDSMVESDKSSNKNKENETKNIKNSLNNKNNLDKNLKFDYNGHLKNKINFKTSQENLASQKLAQINKIKHFNSQDNIEKYKLKLESNKKFNNKLQKNIIFNENEENKTNVKKFLNDNEFLKFKKYKRRSFDDNRLRAKNELNNYKPIQLNHRYSIANIKVSEKEITSEFYDELTEAINKVVNKIKAKPNDLKKREILFNYIKSVAKKIFPESKVYRYGSLENGFSLTDGDIDICILNKDDFKYTPAECVEILGEKLKNNGIDDIKLLIRARVPIIKMKDNKSGISCDIGFQNRLAIQNTKLINAYSKIDERFKQMVFIIKYWSKIKNINEPYMGTLSSYCFILMIIHFLQIRKPPVLPNLQKIYLENFSEYQYIDNFNVSFFEDIENLHKYWTSENKESLGELLVDFFKYFANDFPYISGVASIRTGTIITKEEKEWTREHQFEINKSNSVKDRYWFCVEDPFELTHNLGRPVDKKSLFKIRGEFLKVVKIINNKNLSGLQVLENIIEKGI